VARSGWWGRVALGVAMAFSASLWARAAEEAAPPKGVKILGISCSPRQGKTTSAALDLCLKAAQEVSPAIEVELIELAGLKIEGAVAAGEDDFQKLVPKLTDPKVAGIIIGSPTYFGGPSSLCRAFLERWMVFRKGFALSNKVGGALAVGGARNGGQELVIQSIQAAMLCQEMVVVGDGKPTAHFGATLVSKDDSIAADDFGVATARNLGRRVAEVALRLAGR